MNIKSIRCENYRNIEKAKIEFSKGVNLLYGDNAQGKTNVIEAIYTFARGKSFRLASDKKLVRFGQSGYKTEIEFENLRRTQTLLYEYKENEKIKKRNGVTEKKLSDMLGHFRAVLFCPENLMIVKGGPSERRDFINVGISQNDIIYLKDYSVYQKILENRNTVIKAMQKIPSYGENEIEIYSEQMAKYCAKIYTKRKEYIKKLEKYAKDELLKISEGKENLTLEYESDVTAESEEEAREKYLSLLTENIGKETAAGISLYGVHRDDVDIRLNGVSSRNYASQGQARSVTLSLKMAEGEVSREINGEYPVFLFDDVLSELDKKRQKYILTGESDRQIIITACDVSPFENENVNIINVEGGVYVSSHR